MCENCPFPCSYWWFLPKLFYECFAEPDLESDGTTLAGSGTAEWWQSKVSKESYKIIAKKNTGLHSYTHFIGSDMFRDKDLKAYQK